VPVVKKAGDRGVADLATAISDLAGSARSRELSTADLSGVTFTVSNIGAVGGGFGTPIVPLGTTAILSVGRADEQPVVRDGKVTSAVMMPLSLSYDHRVIDGGLGRRFLAMVVENLEEPALFLAE
jgi:pyruvate dehydrogenase E2 component (dihydrolipoamide acetyltransferase)